MCGTLCYMSQQTYNSTEIKNLSIDGNDIIVDGVDVSDFDWTSIRVMKPANDRSTVYSVRFNADEFALLCSDAESAGMKVGTYIKHRVFRG